MSDDKELDHEYDGIRESDNDLPNWWLNIFYVSIVFSIGYMIYYHWGGNGPGQMDNYNKVMAQVAENSTQTPQSYSFTEDELAEAQKSETQVSEGKKIYDIRCIACHGAGGAGGIGPNLVDSYWLHGGKPTQIANIISEGVLDKGMVAWKALLSKKEIIAVTTYVRSIYGTNPANPKAPQGNKE
ncbi:MAG: c-type cytochrome [Oligoflexia bacterium]|nr:c-type cytochrome [Oligoflexia bacterium]